MCFYRLWFEVFQSLFFAFLLYWKDALGTRLIITKNIFVENCHSQFLKLLTGRWKQLELAIDLLRISILRTLKRTLY